MKSKSFKRLELVLHNFTESDEPGVMLLRGDWGVGKTYACKQALTAKKEEKQKPFSYVSLYGVGTIEDIYSRITFGWTNSVTQKLPRWMTDILGDVAGKATKGLASIPKVGGFVEMVGAAGMGLMARDALIVIDDLERRDSKLSIKAVLGVVSYLAESRNCRVIFVSNDNALGSEKAEFEEQKEKVFDLEYVYNPTVEENAALFDGKNDRFVLPTFKALGVRNIRVIRRVNTLVTEVRSKLIPENKRANELVLRNAAILATLHYGFRATADLNKRKAISYITAIPGGLRLGKNFDQPESTGSDKLFEDAKYSVGPVDEEVVEYLQQGVMDWDDLNEKIKNREDICVQDEVREKLQDAAFACLANFIASEDEVVDAIQGLCEKHAELIPPPDLMMASEILSRMGIPSRQMEWLERWGVRNIPIMGDREIHDTLQAGSYPESVMSKIRDEAKRRKGKVGILEVLTSTFGGSADPSDLHEIAEYPASKYEIWLETTNSPMVRPAVRFVFMKYFGSENEDERKIAQKMSEALDSLARKSSINKLRVADYKSPLAQHHEGGEAPPA